MKIIVVCAAGMSTTMLVAKMKEAARNSDIKIEVTAIPETDVNNNVTTADVVLLGPQVRYKLDEIKEICSPLNIPVEVIDTVKYGMMDGNAIVSQAIELYHNK